MSGLMKEVIVAGIRQLSPRVREYILRSADGAPLPRYEPGSHVELHTASPLNGQIVRHYSLVGGTGLTDDPADRYRIAVQRENRQRGSDHIHARFEIGTRLAVSRPKNNFPLNRRDGHSLLIAGGIGITPIYSMLRSLVRRRRPFELVYAGRSRAEIAYADEVEALAAGSGRLHLSGGHLDLRTLLEGQPAGTTAYVCGPAPMIAATHDAARALGWAEDRVRSEMFTAGPSPDDVSFAVELRRSGRTIAVGRDASILDALTAAGIDVLSDCRRGECGLCPLPVLSADGPIRHRDRYLSAEERAAGTALCICVSRIAGTLLVLDA